MKRAALALLLAAAPAGAQLVPTPGFDDPRLQIVSYDPVAAVRLVAFPASNLTLMLLPGDTVSRATVSDPSAFAVTPTGARDSLDIMPQRADASATLVVETPRRRYHFELATGEGLMAAYVVRFVDPAAARPAGPAATPAAAPAMQGTYKVTGEAALIPTRIGDDGERTYIEWGKYQSLPAVFGIGPAGTEEVVDGYMRGGMFTIDRVYTELVFRIDAKRAIALRRYGLGAG